MRFQTSGKGGDAEEQVMEVLNDFKERAGFASDEVRDLSRVAGAIPRNKIGTLLISS